MEEIELAKNEAGQSAVQPMGHLRVTAPVDFGHSMMPHLIERYIQANKDVTVDLIATNQKLDLVAENIDIALRIGNLEDSTLIMRKLGKTTVSLFASPSYIHKYGQPNHPREIENHVMIGFIGFKNSSITLHNQRKTASIKMNSRVWCDDPQAAKAFVVSGSGIGLLTSLHVTNEIKNGLLKPILPDWNMQSVTLCLVYPRQRFLPLRVRRFIDIAIEECSKIESLE